MPLEVIIPESLPAALNTRSHKSTSSLLEAQKRMLEQFEKVYA